MERKWVIAAFLDISGFRQWTYRASTAPEIKEKFLSEFYDVLQCYVRNHKDAWSKYEGDALITAREFTPLERKDPKVVMAFILGLRCLLRKVKGVIRECEDPPPDVRIRIMAGYVYKIMVLDPNDPERKRMIPEYVDYLTNTLRGLLGVNPEIGCLATENVVRSLAPKQRSILRARLLKKPSCYPKGVNREDVDSLQILKF